MYIKVAILSLLIAVPVVGISALIEYGVSLQTLSSPSFWMSHLFSLFSYSIVASLSIFLFRALDKEKESEGGFSFKFSFKPKANREQGSVKWFNSSKGYGFITRDQGDDVFVHYRSISGKGHRSLYEGQIVEFSVSDGDKGLQADEVKVISGEPKRASRHSND